MTLYQQLPKQSIDILLQGHFSTEQLLAAGPEINALLHSCRTMSELTSKLSPILERKLAATQGYSGRKSVSEIIQYYYESSNATMC